MNVSVRNNASPASAWLSHGQRTANLLVVEDSVECSLRAPFYPFQLSLHTLGKAEHLQAESLYCSL
jgi:hypothetical protein